MTDFSRFYQSETWVTREGTRLAIRDMTESHAGNAVRFLERRANRLALAHMIWGAVLASQINGEMADLSVESDLDRDEEIKAADVLAWLHSLPLVRALRKRAGLKNRHKVSKLGL